MSVEGANVVAGFEEVGCKAVPQGVAGGRLGDARRSNSFPKGALKYGFMEVVQPSARPSAGRPRRTEGLIQGAPGAPAEHAGTR